MYTEYYNLSARPFQLTPDPKFYVDTKTHRKAMAYLTYGLGQGEGFIIITGDVGAGKTTLVGRLLQTIDKSRLVVANIVTSLVDADNLLKMIASALGIATDGLDVATLLNRLEKFLRVQHHQGRRVLLIVDEAQNLPVGSLEQLRMLSNFTADAKPLSQTILLGQPEFREKLSSSGELEQLRQRVIASHHLEPLKREEMPEYVENRLALCGWSNDPTFSESAYDALFEYSGGVPRKLNNLCARVLLFGALEERHEIGEDTVREVVDDLHKDNAPREREQIVASAASNVTAMPGARPFAGGPLPSLPSDERLLTRIESLERYAVENDRNIRHALRLLSDLVEQNELGTSQFGSSQSA
jgi:putative secretion ATPase (PEP-CTERM system associated)